MNRNRYPDQDEIDNQTDALLWIDERFLRNDPAAFANASDNFQAIITLISRELDVDRNGIFCVGSGATGLSLNPQKVRGSKLKLFDENSDIDLAVISAHHFELAWRDLRRATQPHLEEIPEALRGALSWQKKRLFDGVILVNKVMAYLSFSPSWQGALERVSQEIVSVLGRNTAVNLWLYRDYWSLRNYICEGLQRCRQQIRTKQEG